MSNTNSTQSTSLTNEPSFFIKERCERSINNLSNDIATDPNGTMMRSRYSKQGFPEDEISFLIEYRKTMLKNNKKRLQNLQSDQA